MRDTPTAVGSGESKWIDLLDPEPDELAQAVPSHLHEIVTERLLAEAEDDDARPRLEAHDGYLFGVLVVASGTPGDAIIFQEIDFIVTHQGLVTVRKTPPIGEPISLDGPRAAQSGGFPGMCLYHLIDEIAERFLALIDEFDDSIDTLEDNVNTWTASEVRERIAELRHDLLHIRRVLTPTRDLARSVLDGRIDLADADDMELFPRDVEIRFADAYDKLLRATDGLDLSRDLLAGVRDYHQAQVANDQNEVMKRLTVIASVLLLPTLIVGLYGQNLKGGPEFGWSFGYWWSWGLIIVTTIAQLIFFRRKRWI